ncbi:hypothetical protein [Lichenicoccus sp.]|uniref:hypothetical protein n=1 Tax=Lichenicoccus sp. TaxID=2781899 RepID=UPI003D0BC164
MARSRAWTAAPLVGCLLLSACGGSEGPTSFPPPDYSYLPKLRLNVGSLSIVDNAAASPDDLARHAPTPPDQALQTMARQRLIAAGNSGSGVFTIDRASITSAGGGALDGRLAVHLDILTGNGGHAGYAEAHVSRQFVPGDGGPDDGTRAELYDLTQQMMRDMNVEIEYQVQRTLKDWLVDASGAPLGGSVEQQALPPPNGASAAPATSLPVGGASVGTTPLGATPLAPTPLAPAPIAPPPQAPASLPSPASPAPQRSPPPGFLQPPAGTAPNGT